MTNILITGTSRGFGKSLVDSFSRFKECRVFSINRTSAKREDDFIVDISDHDSLRLFLGEFANQLSDIDVLILNAGTLGSINHANQVSVDDLKNVLNVNFYSSKILIDHFIENSKCKLIIFISSGASSKGYGGWLEYCCSKSIVDALIRVYAREFPDIHFASCSPGAIKTGMQDIICGHKYVGEFPDLRKFVDMNSNGELRDPGGAADALIDFVRNLKDYDHASGAFIAI